MSEVKENKGFMAIKGIVDSFFEIESIEYVFMRFDEIKIKKEDYKKLGEPKQRERLYEDEDRYQDWFLNNSKKLVIQYYKYCEDGDYFIVFIEGWKK
jgi:hypothetical protein